MELKKIKMLVTIEGVGIGKKGTWNKKEKKTKEKHLSPPCYEKAQTILDKCM